MSTFSRLKVSTVLILVTILTHLEKIGYELLQHFWLGCSFFGGKYLQKLVVFMNLTNAVFEGDGRMEQGFHETVWQSTVHGHHSSTGIAFINSSNITFRYTTITNCGADMTSFCLSNTICNGSLGYFKMSYKIAIDYVLIQKGQVMVS